MLEIILIIAVIAIFVRISRKTCCPECIESGILKGSNRK